jgi:hypothetical protein
MTSYKLHLSTYNDYWWCNCCVTWPPYAPHFKGTFNVLDFSSVTLRDISSLYDSPTGVRSPAEAKGFSLKPLCPDQLWGPPSLLYNGYRGSFSRGWSAAGTWRWQFTPPYCRGQEWVGAIPLPLSFCMACTGQFYFHHRDPGRTEAWACTSPASVMIHGRPPARSNVITVDWAHARQYIYPQLVVKFFF